jgi:hypothetical protein
MEHQQLVDALRALQPGVARCAAIASPMARSSWMPGSINTVDNELLALRDKANLALGFAWLQAGDAAGNPYLSACD